MTDYHYTATFTRNMGDFESLKISEGITESKLEGETTDKLRARVKEKVEGWLFEDIEDVEREVRGLRSRLDAEKPAGK